MFIKKKNYKLLDKSIEDLSSTLEKANIKEIVETLLKEHPYEEPAYEVYEVLCWMISRMCSD